MTKDQLTATVEALLGIIKAQKFKEGEAVSMRYLVADLHKYEHAHIAEVEEAVRMLVADGTLIRKSDTYCLSKAGYERVYQ